MMTVADDLIAVRSLLAERGRAVNAFSHQDGSICLQTAILIVSEIGSEKADTHLQECNLRMLAMMNTLIKQMPTELQKDTEYIVDLRRMIESFNDFDAKDDQDVYDLIDKALADLGAN